MTDLDSERPLYYDMQALLSGELPPPPRPTCGCRDDGHHIFYSDQVNLVFGDPETGKTWLCIWCAAAKLINDPTSRVVIIDMDHNGPTATAARFLAFGVPKEVLSDPNRFRYVEPDDRLHMAEVIEDLITWRPTVAVVDSLGELMPLYGANSYSGDDFTAVNARVLKPLAKAGATVLVIDHLSKGADSRNFGPVGTAAKRRAIGGVSLRVTVKDAFTPGSGGAAYLKVNKDRHGGLREHCPTGDREPLAGTFTMRAFKDNQLTGEIKAADGTENVTDDHALSSSQARNVAADVASLESLNPPPKSVRDVRQRMSWGDTRAQDALKAWRESTGQAAPKNQHGDGAQPGVGDRKSAVPGYGTPYVSGTAGTAGHNGGDIAPELRQHTGTAVPQANGATATVTELDTRRSPDTGRPIVPCPRWLALHIDALRKAGHTTVESLAVVEAGTALGYTAGTIRQAASHHPDIKVIARSHKNSTWSITGDNGGYKPATDWVHSYLDNLPAGTTIVDQDAFKAAAETAEYSWAAARAAMVRSGRIESVPVTGNSRNDREWQIIIPGEETSA